MILLNRLEAMRLRQMDLMLDCPDRYGIDADTAQNAKDAIAALQVVIARMVDEMRQSASEDAKSSVNVSGEYLRLASMSALCDETILRGIISRLKAAKRSADAMNDHLSKIEWALQARQNIDALTRKAQLQCDKLAAACIIGAAASVQKEQGVTMESKLRPMVLLPGSAR